MNRIQLIFNEKWAMAREDYYNLVSLIRKRLRDSI